MIMSDLNEDIQHLREVIHRKDQEIQELQGLLRELSLKVSKLRKEITDFYEDQEKLPTVVQD